MLFAPYQVIQGRKKKYLSKRPPLSADLNYIKPIFKSAHGVCRSQQGIDGTQSSSESLVKGAAQEINTKQQEPIFEL